MRVLIASDQVKKLSATLQRAGSRETGGQLFGEQLAPSEFRVIELTIQSRPGTIARFVVDLVEAVKYAMQFFDRTKHQYLRYNYVGEWHSHPSYDVRPSGEDTRTMHRLVCDKDFRGNFAVLVIVRLDGNVLRSGAWLFNPEGFEQAITLEMEHEQ
jgi:proteasome lid subunit RPN8/RPN11